MIRAMAPEHVGAVVDIHLRAFPADFLTSLGRAYLAEVFYPGFLAHPRGVALVDWHEGVRGFIVGSADYRIFYRWLTRSHGLRLLAALAATCLRRPSHFFRVLSVSRLVACGPTPPFEGDLGYIAIAPGSSGAGIGKALVGEFLERLAAAGASGCWTKTREDNVVARRLYEGCGFRRQERFYSDGGWWFLYGRPLGTGPGGAARAG